MELIITTKLELQEIVNIAIVESMEKYLNEHKKKASTNQNLSIKEVAYNLGVTETTVRNYIKKGHLNANKIGGRIFIDKANLELALKEVKSLKYKR